MEERLQKIISKAGLASRRAAETHKREGTRHGDAGSDVSVDHQNDGGFFHMDPPISGRYSGR